MKNLVQSFKNLIFSQKCPVCGRETDGDYFICSDCYGILRKKGTMKNIGNYYYLYYYDRDIKKVIADYKLKNRKILGKELAQLSKRALKKLIVDKEIDIVIPVPISEKRYKERGFNQVEEFLNWCEIKYRKIYREKDTEHMYSILNVEKREKNIADAFKNRNLKLDRKNILIVDDIVTTGTTIKEIKKEITKNSSPENIYVFSIAISRVFKE